MSAQLKRIRRVLRRRWPAVAAIALAAGLLVLFLLYSRSSGPVQVYPAFSTPVSREMIGVPRFVGGPTDLARDFAWRQALVLVEIEAAAPQPLGTVIDQFPVPQMLIRAGDTLTVTVSVGTAGEVLPTDARAAGRVPLRLTPISLATAAVRQTQTARRAVARTAEAAAADESPTPATVGATPTDSDAVATRRASEAARDAGATRTVTTTATTTGTPPAPASTATATPPSPVPTAVGTRPPPERTREPATSAPSNPTEAPDPPEPPTPPPPPPEAGSRGGGVSRRTGVVARGSSRMLTEPQ